MEIEHIPAELIQPLHEVQDAAKVQQLVESMRASGWVGDPVLATPIPGLDSDTHGLQAWSATHRLAAATHLGISVPVLVFELTGDQREELETAGHLVDSKPVDQITFAIALHGLDEMMDSELVSIYADEARS